MNTNNLPSFDSFVNRKLSQTEKNNVSFDPCKLIQQRNNQESPSMPEVKEWDVEDVKKLEEFCTKHGILGYNFGRMNPKLALLMLKKQMGVYTDTPMEERVPLGYESMNKKNKKDLLCG